MRVRRRLGLLALLAAAGVVCLAAGLFPQEPLRALVESRLRGYFGPVSHIGRLHVVPGRLRAEVEDIAISAPNLVFSARRLTVSAAPSLLFGGAPRIREVSIDGARLVVHATQSAGGTGLLPVIVEGVNVRGGTLVYEDPALGGAVTLSGVDVRGGLGAGSLSLAAREGTWARDRPIAIGPIRGTFRISKLLSVEVESFEAHVGPSWLRARGALGRIGAIAPRLEVDGSADLASVTRAFDLLPSRGALTAHGTVEGSGQGLRSIATMRGEALLLGSWPVDTMKAGLSYDARGRPQSKLTLGVRALGGTVDGEASLDGSTLDARMTATGLDIARAAGSRTVEGRVSADLTVRGSLDAALEAHGGWQTTAAMEAFTGSVGGRVDGLLWPGRRAADLTWEGHVEGSSPVPGGGTRFARLRGSASGTARGAWPLDVDGKLDASADFDGPGGLHHVPVAATLESRGKNASLILDSQALGGTIHAEVGTRGAEIERLSLLGDALDLSQLSAPAQGHLAFDLSSTGTLARPKARGTATIDGLEWKGMKAGPATASLDAAGGEAHVIIALPELRLQGEARGPVSGRGSFRGTLDMADSPVAPFGRFLEPDRPLDGSVRGRISFDMPLTSPAPVRASAHVERLTLSSGAFSAQSERPFDLELADRQVTITGMALRGPGYELEASGSLGVGERDPIALDLATSAELGSLTPVEGRRLAGHVQGRAALSGSRVAPHVSGLVEARDLTATSPEAPALSAPTVRLEMVGDAIRLDPTELHIGAGTVTASGRLPLASFAKADPAIGACEAGDLHLSWHDIEVSDVLSLLAPETTASLKASLTGTVDVQGCPRSPQTLSGALHLADTTLRAGDLAVNLSPVDLRLDSGRFSTLGITLWTQEGSLEVGGVVDAARKELDLNADGRLALRALSPVVGTAAFSGVADVSLAVGGTFAAPRPTGSLWLRDVAIRMRDIPDSLTGVNGILRVEGTGLRLEDTRATLGGGTVTATGGAQLHGRTLSDVDVKIVGSDLALRYPPGLRSRLNADLTLTGRSGALRLGGVVHVVRGLYDLDLAMQQGASTPVAAPTPSPLLRSVVLAVRVDLDNPVLIRNRLASLDVTGGLRFQGDMETPAPLGRLDFREGGRVYVQGREFAVQNGGLVYEGDWNPVVSLRATTRIRATDQKDYDVDVVADGPLDTVRPRLESSGHSEAQALSLVATGNISGNSLTTGARVAGGETASLLVGRLSRGLGLDQISVQPELLSREADPGTRFTFGKQLSTAVSLIYSVGLSGPEQRFAQITLQPYRGVSLLAQRSDDGVFTVGAGQRLRFGGPRRNRPARNEERVRLESVRLEGDQPLPEKELRSPLKAQAGKEVTSWSIQDDADRLRRRLVKASYLEAEVGGRIEGQVAVFRIHAGPRFEWKVTGMSDPPDLARTIGKALFEEDALDRGRARLLSRLRSRGFLRARVDAHGVDEGGGRTLLFEAHPGDKLLATVLFPGAHVLSSKDLLRAVGGAGELLTSPDLALERIRGAYRAHEHFGATAGPVKVEEAPGHVVIEVRVDEGLAARIATVQFEGAAAISEADLRAVAGVETGAPFVATAPSAAAERVRQRYFGLGFPHVRVAPEARQQGADVDLVLHIEEGAQIRVGQIQIVGLGKTHEALVRKRIRLDPGDPLDPRRLAEAERHLLELGIFSQALVTASDDNPADITVRLEERAPVAASYDVRYNDQDKTTGLIDAEVRNLFGVGLTTGGRYRIGADVREARGSAFLPSVLGGSLTTTVFHLEEDLDAIDPFTEEPFTSVQTTRGFQVQQSVPLPNLWHGLFGYQWKRLTLTTNTVPATDAFLDASLFRDTRDNPLDASRGRFLVLNVSASPKAIGSDIRFIKAFAQGFFVRPLTPHWLWAQGYRLGLARGFAGQKVSPIERFKAGGANSIRGFATDSLGPSDIDGTAAGGEAVVIVNEELRYRHPTGLGFALFYDAGNVFLRVSTMSFALKHALGIGLRWDSPVGLLRLDLGFPLNPAPAGDNRPADAHHQIFFSLGQAF